MIAYLKGELREVFGNSCLLQTNGGVGYELALTARGCASLPPTGGDVEFYTFLAVREDALELYGFNTFAERQAFAMLTGISRVGCRTALAILSMYSPADLSRIVAEEDVPALARVSGIGAKTAQHIFLELKYRLKNTALPAGGKSASSTPSIMGDVLAALANLGYAEEEYTNIVKKILGDEPDLDVGGALRKALQAMSSRRN